MRIQKPFSFLFLGLLLTYFCGYETSAQVKTYFTVGRSDMFYHNKKNSDIPSLSRWYYGIEVDKYLNYNYALSTGAYYIEGGYDNGISRWFNKFIQVPVGIKMAALGDKFGIVAGLNFNYLLKSQLTELCDTLGNYHTDEVTSALKRVQPDFAWGLLFRINRVTAQMKFSHALTNRFSTKVQTITDQNPCYYGSYYAYIIGKEEQKLKVMTTYFTLSVRLF